MKEPVLIGLDLGTQGVRGMAVTPQGRVLAAAERAYERINCAEPPAREQRAEDWADAALSVLAELAAALPGDAGGAPVLLSVDGTSGTIVPVDRAGRPLRTALMYNDPRASAVIDEVRQQAAGLQEKLGYRLSASFGLPRLRWIRRFEPEIYERTETFLHQADYVAGVLTGNFRVTDYANALKTGYDLLDDCWPEEVLRALELDPAKLPQVAAPGQTIGTLTAEAAGRTGLPARTAVVAGVTDGYASGLAAGAVRPGDLNSTVGTTLVLKGVSQAFLRDPLGRVYCHRHPQGYWYPGGASNVGGLCLNAWFGKERFARLNDAVERTAPTGNLIYPLTMRGERFPFANPDAEAFFRLRDESEEGRYAGAMEGVAYVERLCCDVLTELGCRWAGWFGSPAARPGRRSGRRSGPTCWAGSCGSRPCRRPPSAARWWPAPRRWADDSGLRRPDGAAGPALPARPAAAPGL